jgi:hypothetical protein
MSSIKNVTEDDRVKAKFIESIYRHQLKNYVSRKQLALGLHMCQKRVDEYLRLEGAPQVIMCGMHRVDYYDAQEVIAFISACRAATRNRARSLLRERHDNGTFKNRRSKPMASLQKAADSASKKQEELF